MAGEGSSSGAKRAPNHDLDSSDWDDNVPTPLEITTTSNTQSAPSSSSQGKKKYKGGHEKNPEYPPKDYGHFVRDTVLEWYKVRTPAMLDREYIDRNQDGFKKLQVDLGLAITRALETSERYNNYNKDYWEHGKWMEEQIISSTSNIVHGFECVYKKGENGAYNPRDCKLYDKLKAIQEFVARNTGNRSKIIPWRLQILKAAMERHMGGGLVYLPDTAKVIVVPGFGNEGGYGLIRKVRIEKVANIPEYIEFAGKMSKATNNIEKRESRAIEALACPVEHPGLIKFWAVHQKSMEAYTLWWNGGSFKSFMIKNDLVGPGVELEDILNDPKHTMEDLEMIKAYRTNAAKLALSLIITIARIHKNEILHNDISPSNILLHFPRERDVEKVYIGVCDWGMASRFCEDKKSVYGYQSKGEMEQNRSERYWVAPELFYVYGPPNSETSIDRVSWKHLYTKESDAYAVGMLAIKIWHDEWDKNLFKTQEGATQFYRKITALIDKDPKARPSLAQVLESLQAKPFEMEMPKCCFRYEI